MFQSVLVPLTGFDSDKAALETAYLAGRLFGAHIACLWVRPNPAHFSVGAMESYFVNDAAAAKFLAEEELRTEAARLAFAEFCENRQVMLAEAPPGTKGVSAASRELVGNAVETTLAQARSHDLVVLARAPRESHLGMRGIGAILIGSGRPVLLATEHVPENLAATIAVAWKDAPESARALAVSMPFIEKAEQVFVLAADDEGAKPGAATESAERVATTLRWNGLRAEARYVVPGGQTLAEALIGAASACGADLLVMGAYGHSRVQELVFGGVTRHVLAASPLPVLMFH